MKRAAAGKPQDLLLVIRWCAAIAWVTWTATLGLLWLQHRVGVLHPHGLLLLSLLALTLIAGLIGGIGGSWRLLRGPRRQYALIWSVAYAVPVALWAMLGLYAVRELGRGYAPNNFCWKLITMATASVMEVQAAYTYPSRLETGRLVMFYDERVTRPQRDAEVMEKHVARLEAMTGRPLRAKIHWVRGRLLGRENMACRGLALGSAQSPDDWESADHPDGLSVDRHELAHAVLHQLCQPDIDPPFLFAEGWADSQAGPRSSKLASWALGSRDVWRERSGLGEHVEGSYLKELVGPSWYHRIGGPVYNVGGAFVDHLLRRYGAARFLELYFACKQDTFEADFRSVIGEDLDVVERRFWDEAEKLAGPAGTVTR